MTATSAARPARPDAFTPEEDAAILAGAANFRAVARALGRSRAGVMARHADLTAAARRRARWAPPPGVRRDAWTPGQLDYLRANWGVLPDAAVCAVLGRGVDACRLVAGAVGAPRRANAVHLVEVARVFGVRPSAVRVWVDKGWLAAEKRPVRQGPGWLWHVPAAALRRFVDRYGHPRDLERMAPGHWLTAYARQALGLGEGDAWLTVREAAALVHFSPGTVSYWIARGRLAARGRGGQGRHALPLVVRRRDAEAAAAAQYDAWRGAIREGVLRYAAAQRAARSA